MTKVWSEPEPKPIHELTPEDYVLCEGGTWISVQRLSLWPDGGKRIEMMITCRHEIKVVVAPPIGTIDYAKYNGAGEIVFRQLGHDSQHQALIDDGWTPVGTLRA